MAGTVQGPGEDEQQVGKPVQIDTARRRYVVVRRERHDGALGPPADGTRDVDERGGTGASRQDELLQRREIGVVVLDRALQPVDVRRGDRLVAGNRQLPAEIEEIVLDVGQQRPHGVLHVFREHDADRRVELVDGADRFDARAVLGDARAIAETRGAGVPGAGDDFRQAMTHGFVRAK